MSGEIDAPWVRLELASRPESARLVRSMSSAAGAALGFDAELLADVNTAVTEACNNVILHAYGDGVGPMSVELRSGEGGVEVRVCDQGDGIRHTMPDREGLKVGLALMSAVADRAEFINIPDGGTEVRLSFRPPAGRRIIAASDDRRRSDGSSAWQAELHSGLNGDVVLTVSPVALLGTGARTHRPGPGAQRRVLPPALLRRVPAQRCDRRPRSARGHQHDDQRGPRGARSAAGVRAGAAARRHQRVPGAGRFAGTRRHAQRAERRACVRGARRPWRPCGSRCAIPSGPSTSRAHGAPCVSTSASGDSTIVRLSATPVRSNRRWT